MLSLNALRAVVPTFALTVVVGCGGSETAPHEASGHSYDALETAGGYQGSFNLPNGHNDRCVKLAHDAVELRYADFTPTGYKLSKSQLNFKADPDLDFDNDPNIPGNQECKSGFARLDAQEIVITSQGLLVFHRGGHGYTSKSVRYGHLAVADIASAFSVGSGFGNGKPCEASVNPQTKGHFRIKVASINAEMHYCKTGSACNSADTTNSYESYGDPAQDKGDALPNVHYTPLSWSWINVPGGGVYRTLLRDGDEFYRCDVPSIKLASVTDTGKKNGWVQAVYGGALQGDKWLYGWIVYAHEVAGTEVPHVAPYSDGKTPSENGCTAIKAQECSKAGCGCVDGCRRPLRNG